MKVCKRLGRLMEDEIVDDIDINIYHHQCEKKDNPEDYPGQRKPHIHHPYFNEDINSHHQSFFKPGDIKDPGHRNDDYYHVKNLEPLRPIEQKDYPDQSIMFIGSELAVEKIYKIKIQFNSGTVVRDVKEGDIVRAFFVEAGNDTNNLVEVVGKITYIDDYNIIHIDYSEKYSSDSLAIPIYAIRFITTDLAEKVPFIEYDKKNDFCAPLLPDTDDKVEYEDPGKIDHIMDEDCDNNHRPPKPPCDHNKPPHKPPHHHDHHVCDCDTHHHDDCSKPFITVIR